MAISKILDFSAGSKFAKKLSQDIRYDRESQNCDWVLFSVTPLLNLADSLPPGTTLTDGLTSDNTLLWLFGWLSKVWNLKNFIQTKKSSIPEVEFVWFNALGADEISELSFLEFILLGDHLTIQ